MYHPLLNCLPALYTPLSDPLLYLHPIFLFVLLYCCGFSPSCFGTWKQSFISLFKTEEARLKLKWLRLPGLTAINVDNHRLSCDKSLSECGFVCGNSHNLDHYLIHSFHVNFTYIWFPRYFYIQRYGVNIWTGQVKSFSTWACWQTSSCMLGSPPHLQISFNLVKSRWEPWLGLRSQFWTSSHGAFLIATNFSWENSLTWEGWCSLTLTGKSDKSTWWWAGGFLSWGKAFQDFSNLGEFLAAGLLQRLTRTCQKRGMFNWQKGGDLKLIF